MQPIALQIATLQAQLPELVLRPGMTLPARLLERQGDFGVLLLKGAPLAAQLPAELAEGARMRLRVAEVTSDRVVLRVVDTTTPTPPGAAAVPHLPLPDGSAARVTVDEREGEGGAGRGTTVILTYESPALGPSGLRVELRGGAIAAAVTAGMGEPFELASAGADELREALAEATGRPAEVRVLPRRDSVDVYA